MDNDESERDTVECIGRLQRLPSSNKDEESEVKEEDVGATQASTEYNSPIDEYEEGREYNQEDSRKDTVLSNAKNTEEEASLRHKGESSSLDLSERSDDSNEDDDRNNPKDNN